MKNLISSMMFLTLFMISPSLFAGGYSSSRCQVKAEGARDKTIEFFKGKFKEVQKNCCKNAMKAACPMKSNYDGCQKTFYSIQDDCSEDCKLFVKDCEDSLEQTDIADVYFDNDEE